jgi:hypothetical protein
MIDAFENLNFTPHGWEMSPESVTTKELVDFMISEGKIKQESFIFSRMKNSNKRRNKIQFGKQRRKELKQKWK